MNWKEHPHFDLAIARDLLRRAGVGPAIIDSLGNEESLQIALEVCANLRPDVEPDPTWWRQLLSLSADRYVLTEEGWIPAAFNTREYSGAEPMEVLDTVN